MKEQGNFYSKKKILFFTLFSVLMAVNSYSQTDTINRKINSLFKVNLAKKLSDYDQKQKKAVEQFLRQGYKKIIETKDGEYSELVGADELGNPEYLITHNDKVVNGLKANVLHSGLYGLNLEGSGIRIGLWDAGKPRIAHEMFGPITSTTPIQSRIEYASGQSNITLRHPTHIAGTLIGNQYNPSQYSPSNNLVRGVAYKATIKAWDWTNFASEMLAADSDIKIANTSYGKNSLYMNNYEYGRYSTQAQQLDAIMCGKPEFQIVKSVGNDRNFNPPHLQESVLNGYDFLDTNGGMSKNVLVVGSVNLTDALQTNGNYLSSQIAEPYSNWGPTDDGRIKPDLVSHGNNVYSSIETQNYTYGYYTGTSQAAAGVTGGIALLHNYWNSKFSTTMWSSTVRALLIHSIDEIDDKGPDYRNGWGVVNLQKAANLIEQRGKSVIIRESVLNNGDIVKINVAANGVEDLKVTIAWTDPAGDVVPVDINNPNGSVNETAAKLVNDLDIRLIRKDVNGNDDSTLVDPTLNPTTNNLLFPWILKQQIQGNTYSTLGEKAQRGINNRDNVEKIEVYETLIPNTGGMFQLEIKHKGVLANACQTGQPYSLIISGVSFCSDNLVFLQNQDNELADLTKTKVLAKTIKASNIIKTIPNFGVTNPDFVEYIAEDYIELLPQSQNGGSGSEGFTAEFGSDFLAHLPCSGINERTAFSEVDIENFKNDTTVDKRIIVEKGEVVIFPNPYINDILNIQFRLVNASTFEIQIYDITGKLVYQDNDKATYSEGVHKKAIDANFLPSGTFIIKTISSDGISSIKLIKK